MHVCESLVPVIFSRFMILKFIENMFLIHFRNHWLSLYTMILTDVYHRWKQVSSLGFIYITKKRTLEWFRNSCIRIFSKTLYRNHHPLRKFFENTVFSKNFKVLYLFRKILTLLFSWKYFGVCEISSSLVMFSKSPTISIVFTITHNEFFRKLLQTTCSR